ncbi:hypothetical protein F5Y19DRAFT_188552 [Xylariaceae sp. FL1651]|nr:hypothetical protein F5Y19DRAFT_188552 [Xylariaceae sp. FL1651]
MKTSMDWHFFTASSPPHYPRHKLKKQHPDQDDIDGCVDANTTTYTRPRVSRGRSHTKRLVNQLRLSLGHKAPSHPLGNSSILSFKAIRYPLDILPNPTPPEKQLIPEFRHLNNATRPRIPQRRANELDRRRGKTASQSSSTPDHAARRRYSKTPCFALGDLERAHSMREGLRRQSMSVASSVGHARTPESEDLGLQICLGMLADELWDAATGGLEEQLRSNVTKLKILLMIEGYSRLQDQLLGSRRQGEMEGLRSLRNMFDVWIEALERVYEKLEDVG